MSTETMIATLHGVREYQDGVPVELWRADNGRLIIRAVTDYRVTDVDLLDLIEWVTHGPNGGLEIVEAERAAPLTGKHV